MKFKYEKIPKIPTDAFPDKYSDLVPIIPVQVIYKDKMIWCKGIIDSGCSCCLFPKTVGEALGVVIPNDKEQIIYGIDKHKIKAYFYDIELSVGGYKYSCYAGFTEANIPPLLGQYGFFDHFSIMFDYQKETIELKPK